MYVFFVLDNRSLRSLLSGIFVCAVPGNFSSFFFCARGTRYKFSEASSIVHLSSKCAGELIFEKFSREFLEILPRVSPCWDRRRGRGCAQLIISIVFFCNNLFFFARTDWPGRGFVHLVWADQAEEGHARRGFRFRLEP